MPIKLIRKRPHGRPRALTAQQELTMVRRYLFGGELARDLRKEYGNICAPTFTDAVKRVRASFMQ